ncbi:hypothetical protein N7450_005865 [Penicillium hetheringtonii]|uniref:Enoyl reductase (ER) domain-containing protein n=1 Tax=Penicillium hetheringtonii TaxID=911720 RepID=A0AAD6DJC4_9EURO|nr:hypothetical protein N7450_005865 [Penicillium hetheringtonii]
MTETMKAWQQAAPGLTEENLKLVDNVARPNVAALKDGEILVRVTSACLNPADYKVLEMGFMSRAAVKFPKVLGMDLSGIVEAVAKGSTDVKTGDNILGRVDPMKAHGSFSEYVVLSREDYAVLPQDTDLDKAAGVPTTGMTAYQSIKPYVKPGDRVFINGGSGEQEHLVYKLRKHSDAIITDIVTELKAEGQIYDLVVDNVGNSPKDFFSTTPGFLKPEGRFVSVGGSASLDTFKTISNGLLRPTFLGGTPRKFVPYFTKNVREDYEQLAKWLADGSITTIIESTFEFEQVIEALKHLKKGSSAGKIIVHVSSKT